MVLLAATLIWFLNIGFGLWRGFRDIVEGRHGQAVVGLVCVVGVNAVLGWMIYISISTSTDL